MTKKVTILSQFIQYFSKLSLISTINANHSGYIMIIISQIQILSLALEELLLFLNEDSDYLYGIYAYLVHFTNPTYILIQAQIESYSTISMYGLFVMVTLFLFIILYHFRKFIKTREKEPKNNRFWGFICVLHEKCLFLIIFRNSLSWMKSNRQLEDSYYYYANLIIILIINMINMLFAGWLCYTTLPAMEYQFKHSMKSRIFNWINLVYKVIAVLIIHFYTIEFYYIKWIGIFVQLIYLIISFYLVFITLLFYSTETEIIIASLIGNTFILTLISTISMILDEKLLINNLRFYIWLLSTPFGIKLTMNILKLKRIRLIEGLSQNDMNEDSVIAKLIHGSDFFNRKNLKCNTNEFGYSKVLAQYHNVEYKETYKFKNENLVNNNDEKGLYNLMNIIYKQGIAKFPNSISIRMIYLNCLLSNKSSRINSYASIIMISQLYEIINKNDYFRRIYVLVLQQCYDSRTTMLNKGIKENDNNMSIDDDDINSDRKTGNILNIIEYNALNRKVEQIKKYIVDALMKYLQFWDEFNHKSSIHSILLLYSLDANKTYRETIKALDNIDQNKDDQNALIFSKSLIYISIFIITVRFSAMQSERCMEIYNYIQKKNEKLYNMEELINKNLYANNNIFITVSGIRKYLGQIITCNPLIQKYLGYDPQSLIAKNISIILPPFFQKRHNQYLANFLNTGKSNGLNSIKLRPAFHEDHSIILVHLFIQAISTVENGLLFLAILRPIHSMDQIITLTYDGKIDGMSASLKKLFEFDSNNTQISFLEIAEGYSFYHNALNFLRFIDFVLLNLEEDNEYLTKICENYQSYVYDDEEMSTVYQRVQNFIFSNKNEYLKKNILKMPEYIKIKTLCDSFTLGEINFNIKLSNKKHFNVKSYIEDQIYQNNEFLRILNIQDIKEKIEIIPSTIILHNSRISYPNEQSSIFENIEKIENPSFKLLNSISKYNKYQKKTKYNIDHENNDFTLDQQSFQLFKLVSGDSKANTIPKIYNKTKKNSFKIIDFTKINGDKDNPGVDSLIPFCGNLFLNTTNKITDLKIDSMNDQLSNTAKTSNHIIEFHRARLRRLSNATSLSTHFAHNYIENKITQAFDHIYVSYSNKFMIAAFGLYTLFSIIIGLITYKAQLSTDANFLQKASALYYWNMTYKKLLDLGYITRDLFSAQINLVPNDVWIFFGIPDDAGYDIGYIDAETSVLKNVIDNFGKSIYSLPPDLMNQILETPIRLYDVDPITFELGPNYTTRNIISASYEFVNEFLAIGSIPLEKEFITTKEIIYVINNIYVDIIQVYQKINNIILKVILDEYSESQYQKLIMCIMLGGLSFICLFILQYQAFIFYKMQHQFLNNLIKLKSWKTNVIQKNIEKVLKIIKNDSTDENLIEFKKDIEREYKFKAKIVENSKTSQYQSKYMKITGNLINKRNYFKGFVGFGYVFGFISIFFINYLLTNERNQKNQKNIQRFIEVLGRYSRISLYSSLFYTYLTNQGNGTFYYQDLSEDLDSLFEARSITSDLLSLFMNDYQVLEYPQYLTGNTCKIVDPSLESFCMEFGQQVNQYGILATEQWAGSRLIMLKESFDISNKSIEVVKEIFKNEAFLDLLVVDFFIQPIAYKGFSIAIKHDIDDGINNGQIYSIELICALLLISAIEILIFGFVIIKRIYYEYVELKALLRMFPNSIFLKHSYFKNFICLTSIPILGNIKNIL